MWLGANFNGPRSPRTCRSPTLPTDQPPVPATLDWDLWLGPAAYRPYHPDYAPFSWRYWWNFANGQLGDFFCHYCDLAFWALKLRHPTTVEAEGPVHPESAARWTIARQEYPARGDLPPVTLHWYNGGAYPELVKERQIPQWGSAVLFIGSQGMLIADYGNHQLLPEAQFADFKRPEPFIPDSIGHHREWTEACKTGGPTTCNFDYSGALTEAALLCNVALRTGKKLTWDAAKLEAVQLPGSRCADPPRVPGRMDAVARQRRCTATHRQAFLRWPISPVDRSRPVCTTWSGGPSHPSAGVPYLLQVGFFRLARMALGPLLLGDIIERGAGYAVDQLDQFCLSAKRWRGLPGLLVVMSGPTARLQLGIRHEFELDRLSQLDLRRRIAGAQRRDVEEDVWPNVRPNEPVPLVREILNDGAVTHAIVPLPSAAASHRAMGTRGSRKSIARSVDNRC